MVTGGRIQELDKSVGLLDGYLRKLAVVMKDVKEVSLGHFLRRKIAYLLSES